jgi:phosphatidylinositol dimannoside acyltransferase
VIPRNWISAARAEVVYLLYRGSAQAMRRLPERFAAAGAYVVGLALTAFRRNTRAMYALHLERVLGRSLGARELRAWTRRVFVNYARYWLEGARLAAVAPHTVLDRLVVESGFEHLVDNMAEGRGVLLALPHVGAWEWGGAWLALKGFPMTSVAEPVEPKALYDFFVSEREAMGLRIVPVGRNVGTELVNTLREGRLVGLLCDRNIVGSGVEVEFFGGRTMLPAGPATLALRTGAALLPTAVYIGPGRYHTAVVMPPLDTSRAGRLRSDVARVTQALAYDLEKLIRRAPDQWYMFHPSWPDDPGYEPARERVSEPVA